MGKLCIDTMTDYRRRDDYGRSRYDDDRKWSVSMDPVPREAHAELIFRGLSQQCTDEEVV